MSIETGTVVHIDGKLVPARRHTGTPATRTNLDLIERWDAIGYEWIECGPRPALTFTADDDGDSKVIGTGEITHDETGTPYPARIHADGVAEYRVGSDWHDARRAFGRTGGWKFHADEHLSYDEIEIGMQVISLTRHAQVFTVDSKDRKPNGEDLIGLVMITTSGKRTRKGYCFGYTHQLIRA